MRDSYEEMLIKLKITQDDFISWGINEIKTLLPDITTVEENWNRLKRCIDSGNEVYIRGYGRDKKNGQINRICNLYKEAGFNTIVRLDHTNNLKPHQLKKIPIIILQYRIISCLIYGDIQKIYIYLKILGMLYIHR